MSAADMPRAHYSTGKNRWLLVHHSAHHQNLCRDTRPGKQGHLALARAAVQATHEATGVGCKSHSIDKCEGRVAAWLGSQKGP